MLPEKAGFNFSQLWLSLSQLEPENGVEFQPIPIEEPENELENLWTTAKSNDDDYQSVVGAIKKGKRTLPTFLAFKIYISDCSLNNNETLFFKKRKWVTESEPLRTQLIQRIDDFFINWPPWTGGNGSINV